MFNVAEDFHSLLIRWEVETNYIQLPLHVCLRVVNHIISRVSKYA